MFERKWCHIKYQINTAKFDDLLGYNDFSVFVTAQLMLLLMSNKSITERLGHA